MDQAKSEQETARIHMPRARHDAEDRAEDSRQEATPGQQRVEILVNELLAGLGADEGGPYAQCKDWHRR